MGSSPRWRSWPGSARKARKTLFELLGADQPVVIQCDIVFLAGWAAVTVSHRRPTIAAPLDWEGQTIKEEWKADWSKEQVCGQCGQVAVVWELTTLPTTSAATGWPCIR